MTRTYISSQTLQRLTLFLVTLFFISLGTTQIIRAESDTVGQQPINLPTLEDVSCAAYLVYDPVAKKDVISKNSTEKIYPASMTKVLTASLALDYLKPDQVLTVSQEAIAATTPQSSLMGLEVGEETTVNELLFGLMLPSGNDAANVLAEAVVTAANYTDPANPNRSKLNLFNDIMNNKVTELGLTGTHFVNPSGLHDENHYTTAADMAKLLEYAAEHEGFRKIISSPTHVYKATNIHKSDAWGATKNTNQLLLDPWILGTETKVAEVVGGKTGTTIPGGAGMAMLAKAQNGKELITVVCGIPYEQADRLTVYTATVLNAGAAAAFAEDPQVRITGNVMDNRQFNAPENLQPEGKSGEENQAESTTNQPEATASTGGAAAETTTDGGETKAIVPISEGGTEKTDQSFFSQNPFLVILLGATVLVVLVMIIFIFVSKSRRRRRRRSGIRRL